MIAVRLQGRLGNQLFQYAFAFAASAQLTTNFYIDQFIELSVIDKYFQIDAVLSHRAITQLFSIRGFKNIFSFHLRRKYYQYLAQLCKLSVKEQDFKSTVAELTLQDSSLYIGYYQSELFFKDQQDLTRKIFSLKKKFADEFRSKYSGLYRTNHIVTVHIRRTDFLNLRHLELGGDDLTLPLTYYKRAIEKFDNTNTHFIFISDDVDFVKENFNNLERKTIIEDTEIMDFQHLINADGCIISNSTFSWWGAWLNNKPNKVIYAPKYFLGWRIKKETPDKIYPESWNQIDFDA